MQPKKPFKGVHPRVKLHNRRLELLRKRFAQLRKEGKFRLRKNKPSN